MKQTGGPENPPLITGPLAVALEANRKLFNSRFAQARRMNRRLDPDNFSRHLVAGVDPVVRSAARVNPDRVDRVVEALFDVSLQLVARECLGPASRYPLINEAWRDLLTRIPHLMVQDPLALSASVSNAVYNLSDEDTADARGWLDLMISLGPDFSTVGEFLEIGQAAAWRFGLAHYREGALEIWANLSDRLKLAVLGLPEDFPISNLDREKIRTDPWRPPPTTWGVTEPKSWPWPPGWADFEALEGLLSVHRKSWPPALRFLPLTASFVGAYTPIVSAPPSRDTAATFPPEAVTAITDLQ